MEAEEITEQAPTPRELLLAEIIERLETMGDLPIFSASVTQVQLVGSDPDSNAVELGVEVLKDANLTTKMLKLANSSYFNRGGSKIGTLSRAVVMLGFDLVKSTVLTMKLIEGFNRSGEGIDIDNLLVKSYMSAGFVKEMAEMSNAKHPEQSYVCGLLHAIGEIIVAATMPEKFKKMQSLRADGMKWSQAQQTVLHMPLQAVGQSVVEYWDFPESMTQTMSPYKGNAKGPIRDQVGLNRSLSSLTAKMMDLLYAENPVTTENFEELQLELAKVSGLKSDVVGFCLEKAFKQSCDLAENYGLNKKVLLPRLKNEASDKDSLRDVMARHLTGQVMSEYELEEMEDDELDDEYDGYNDAPQEVVADSSGDAAAARSKANTNNMLSIIQQLTALISQRAPLNTVFDKVLEGIISGVGFDRAMLCLLSTDRRNYNSRIVHGDKADAIRQLFKNRALDVDNDLFSKVIMEGNEVLVADVKSSEWSELLSENFRINAGVDSFLVAAIQVQGKPIGMFYADKVIQRTDISSVEYRGFLQLISQAQLALQVR